jgi:glycosyltransferase involved in cell wall biosynthesis
MTENFNPLVSIVIPVYNGSNYMREAIDSALNQTYMNIEVLVINDGSNDNGKTREVGLSYGKRIRYFEKENGGVATALNLGIEKMQGEYFSWLSHDDVYFPQKVEIQIDFLRDRADKNIGVYGNFMYIDSDSREIATRRIKDKKRNSLYAVITGMIHGCTLLIPKKYFYEIGFFDPALITAQDYALWFKFFRKYDIFHIPVFLVKSRDHPEQGSRVLSCYSDEREALFSNMLETLGKNDILKFENSISLFYIKIAIYLNRCGLKKSSRMAYNKYLETGVSFYFYEMKYRSSSLLKIDKMIFHLKNPRIALIRINELKKRFFHSAKKNTKQESSAPNSINR